MAIEKKRGCGFRKVGGTYLVGGGIGVPCDRLPFPLTVCSCCGQGIKQGMGWTWIDVEKFFQGPHLLSESVSGERGGSECYCRSGLCPLCRQPETMGRAGLLWVGEKFYKTPGQFVAEGVELGFSKRIKAVPHGFKLGETYIMLAHPRAVADKTEYRPGIFYVWLPQRIEQICLESSRNTEEIAKLEKRGITPVFVPDDDVDHRGNVHDDFAREKKQEAEQSE
jgi:hypothetical protein